jgi:hypothetical protein
MAEGIDGRLQAALIELRQYTKCAFNRLDAKIDATAAALDAKIGATAEASDPKFASLETTMNAGFTRLERRFDQLIDLQQRNTGTRQ